MLSLFDLKRIINPDKEYEPSDNFRILDSWAEYDTESTVTPNERSLEYLCYELESMNPDTGVVTKYYKAIKFARVIRLPAWAKQSTSLMSMQQEVLSGVYENNYNLITIIANVIKPEPLGLLFLYGVQGISKSLEEAKEIARLDFIGFVSMMQGTYRVLELQVIKAKETEWLRSKMYSMSYITMVRGIPYASKTGEDIGNKGMGNKNANPDSEGTLEEIITGLADYEYVIEILSTPVYMDTLQGWQRKSQQDMTAWYSHLQGTTSLSFNLSIPMMYMANASQSQGWSKAYTDANTVSSSQGESFSLSHGQSIGESLSETYSHSVGHSDGVSLSNSHSYGVSETNGVTVGETIGHTVGQTNGHTVGQTIGQTYGQTNGQTLGNTVGHTLGETAGQTYGQTLGHTSGQTLGHTSGHTNGETVGQTFGQSIGHGTSQGVSSNQGVSIGQSENRGISENFGQSVGHSFNEGYSEGQSASVSQGESFSQGHSVGHGTNMSTSQGQSVSNSHSVGQSQNYGVSSNQGVSQSQGVSIGQSVGSSKGVSVSDGFSSGQSWGTSQSHGTSSSSGTSDGWSNSNSDTSSVGGNANVVVAGINGSSSVSSSHGYSGSTSHSTGTSDSTSFNSGGSMGQSHSTSASSNVSSSQSISQTGSYGTTSSQGQSQSWGSSESYGTTNGASFSQSYGASESVSDSVSAGKTVSLSNGVTAGHNVSAGESIGNSYGLGQSYSTGNSYGQSYGQGQSYGISDNSSVSASASNSQSVSSSISDSSSESMSNSASASSSLSSSQSASNSMSQSASNSMSQSASNSSSQSVSDSFSQSVSDSYSQSTSRSRSVSNSETVGNTYGQSSSDSTSDSSGTSTGHTTGTSESTSNGNSYSLSNGSSHGISNGTTGTTTMGTSASMGLGPSIGYNKGHQWMDQGVKDLLELMEFQNSRIKKALRGEGAFYTYVYIACPSLDALSAAQALAKSTWQNENAMVQPLQVLDLTDSEQQHLIYKFSAFSSDVTREDVYGVAEYKYCSVLLPEEFVAYTHLPRISEGGVFSTIQDVPKFSVPSMLKGEIYMGTILNAERFTFKNGYNTQFDYRIDENNLMHGFFTGASRSGKTVAATRFIAELSRVRRSKTGKRLRIVVLDPKQDWRVLARYVEPSRFNFYSMGNVNFRSIKLNPWKVPKGVWPQIWIDGLIDIYCRAYGLLERGKQMIADVVYELYEEAGVFDACDEEDWTEKVPELSSKVNFVNIYKRFEKKKIDAEDPANLKGKMGNDTRDAYARLLERLSCFGRNVSIERKLYGTSEGIGIDELIGDDDVTVLESKGLENTFKNFIFGAVTSGFYQYAIAHEGGYLADDQYETVLVIEEANEILIGTDTAGKGGDVSLPGESQFEQMLDQAAGYGLFIFAITQKIADMPSSVIANSGLVFIGRLKREDDVTVATSTLGKDKRYDDRDVGKWFPRCPTGWFVCQTSRTFDFKDAEPILVKIAPLNIEKPSNLELDEILEMKRISEIVSA